jgi:hypothetical protein
MRGSKRMEEVENRIVARSMGEGLGFQRMLSMAAGARINVNLRRAV